MEIGALARNPRSRCGQYLRDLYLGLWPLVAFRRVLYKLNNFSVGSVHSSTKTDAQSLHLLRHRPLMSTGTGPSLCLRQVERRLGVDSAQRILQYHREVVPAVAGPASICALKEPFFNLAQNFWLYDGTVF